MRLKRTIVAPLLIALVALVTGGWFLQRGVSSERSVYAQARLFDEVMRHISERFVDAKDPSELYEMAVEGLISELGDPHTTFMRPRDYETLRIQTQGEYGGIGAQIGKRGEWITIIAPLPETPAERAGLRAGDQIIEIDGESTRNWSEDQAVARLRGPKGRAVEIRIARPGADQPIPVRIVRAEIHLKSVPSAYMLEPGVGYIDLQTFNETATQEVQTAIEKLRAEGARGLVLDLRGNPGGLLDQGLTITNMFLNNGQLIAETKSRMANQNHRSSASGRDMYPGMPIVVLVGPGSASASEILAGALQDHDRALVLGRTTFGKGSVQTLYPLTNNNWLKITTARWYTPSGRSIQRPFDADQHPVELGGDTTVAGEPEERPEYRTTGGRIVYGGGGIRPDMLVQPDTTTLEERPFVQAMIQRQLNEYWTAKLAYAVRYVAANPDLRPGFEVTPAMLDEFYRTLLASGVEVERSVYDAASRWVAVELGDEITYSKWGEQERRKRRNAADPQVRTAAELLRNSESPQALFVTAQELEARLQATQSAAAGTR
jgi:carboxyl-terminal processing protease